MTENDVKKHIFDYLTMLGWLVIRVNSGAITAKHNNKNRYFAFATWQCSGVSRATKGISDLIAIDYNGRFWAIETKAPGKLKNITDAQQEFLAQVNRRGGVGIVVDDLETVRETISNEYTK